MTLRRLALLAFAAIGLAALPAWPALAECPAGTVQVGEEEVRESAYVIRVSPICEPVHHGPTTAPDPEANRVLDAMRAYARNLPWTGDKRAHLITALEKLDFDGDEVTGTEIRQAWGRIIKRESKTLAAEAAHGHGPSLAMVGAGRQTRYSDCAIFALANASGRPYGLMAADAAALIGKAEWRSAEQRAHPQKAIERDGGVMGGEVIMLAEALGGAKVVPAADFPAALRGGQPILISVVPESGNVRLGHEVVLTRTFQHDGQTWFEMMDSNQGPQRRLYLSAKELNIVLRENGVVFQAKAQRTPKPLRKN